MEIFIYFASTVCMRKPTPNLNESPFGFDEMFFSVTDKRGVIRFGNDVFVRVSVYPKETLLGAPHSIVRHPDMPRAVFKVFWDILQQNKPVGAYVKNMAGNGSYYWVFAFVFPIEDGYLSIRFKPSSALFGEVQKIYSAVLDFETQGNDLNASYDHLLKSIRQSGFPDYEHFIVKAVMEELQSRAQQTLTHSARKQDASAASQITEVSQFASRSLNGVFEKVRGFQDSNQRFSKTIGTLDEGFQRLKFISMNMTIAAAKFGGLAAGLGVVSKEFSLVSREIESHLGGLSRFVETLSHTVQQCLLRIAGLNSQMLMVDFFVKESIAKLQLSDKAFSEMNENRESFSRLFKDYAENLQKEVLTMRSHLSAISSEMLEVNKFVTGLEVIRQIGAVESSRYDDIKSSFVHYLEAMDEFIQLLRNTTSKVNSEVRLLNESADYIIGATGVLSCSVDRIFSLASSFEKLGSSVVGEAV